MGKNQTNKGRLFKKYMMYNKVMSKNNNMENNNKESIRDICHKIVIGKY